MPTQPNQPKDIEELKKDGDSAETLVWYIKHANSEQEAIEHTRQALTQAHALGRQDRNKEIVEIVEKWIQTSNTVHAQDLFDALNLIR